MDISNKSLYEIHKILNRKTAIYGVLITCYSKDMDFTYCQSVGTKIINDYRNEYK